MSLAETNPNILKVQGYTLAPLILPFIVLRTGENEEHLKIPSFKILLTFRTSPQKGQLKELCLLRIIIGKHTCFKISRFKTLKFVRRPKKVRSTLKIDRSTVIPLVSMLGCMFQRKWSKDIMEWSIQLERFQLDLNTIKKSLILLRSNCTLDRALAMLLKLQ